MTMPDNQHPLTILIAADTYPPHVNGAAQFGYRLAKGMTARGHDVHVLACRPGKGTSYSEFRDEATVHRLRSHSVPTHEYFRITFPWEIKKEISLLFDRIQPDVVHIQSHYMIGEHVLYEAVKRGIRIVATNHFMPENLNPFLPFPQWFKDIVGRISWKDMGKVMGQADVVTTPTPLAAKAMHQHAFLRKVLPLSNGIDAAAYELQPGETLERHASPTVLFVGRLAEEKHVDVLIDAVAKTPRTWTSTSRSSAAEKSGRPSKRRSPGSDCRTGSGSWAWPATRNCARPTSRQMCSACPARPNSSPW